MNQMMDRAFTLAARGQGLTRPNPMVGAVLAKKDQVIAEGYHPYFGADHAEVMALKNFDSIPTDHILYCTLEPCCHEKKKTPPCAPMLVQKGLKKIVIASLDPNPLVAGKGVQYLKDHGVEVVLQHCDRNEKLNRHFFYAMRKQQTYFHLKAALSLDGSMALANGESQWITHQQSREYAHKLRSQYDAIMVGAKTVRHDNPSLDVRYAEIAQNSHFRQPKILIYGQESLDLKLKIFQQNLDRLVWIGRAPSDLPKEVKIVNWDSQCGETLAKKLYQELALHSVLVEGGAELLSLLIEKGVFQRVSFFYGNCLMGPGKRLGGKSILSMQQALRFRQARWLSFGSDAVFEGEV